MKINKKIALLWLFVLPLVSCTREETCLSVPQGGVPIGFYAADELIATTLTRIPTTTFPNGGQISVIADQASPDWSSLYFNDIPAYTTDMNPATAYNFNWAPGQTQYWPLNGSPLALVAYSPKNPTYCTPSGKDLNISLPAVNSNMPDVMYGDGIKYGDKRLANRNVNFGLFRHALAQVTVKIVTEEVGAPMYLSAFSIVAKKNARLDLTTGILNVLQANDVIYSYPTQPMLASNTTYTLQAAAGIPFKVYPDSQSSENTFIYIKITYGVSGPISFEQLLEIDDFVTGAGLPASLDRAKQTVLTITIRGTQILRTELFGVIVPWVPSGDFGVNIE